MGSLVQYLHTPGKTTALWRTSTLDPRAEVWLTFEQFRLERGRLNAEVTVDSHLGLRPIRMLLALQSESGRTELRRACEELIPGGKGYWKVRIDSSCWAVIDQQRGGQAPMRLTGQLSQSADKWLVDRWIPWGVPTILYGDGGSGKSLLALSIAVHALIGQPLGDDPNWRMSPIKNILILDWEDTADEFNDRLGALCAGLGVSVPEAIWYKPMQGPLKDSVTELRSAMLEHGTDLVIVDSGSVAAGGELEASETALAFADTLRALPATALVTAHVPWSQTEVEGRRRPFGSIFFRNAFRSLIEVRAAPDDGQSGLHVTLRLEKANRVPLPLPGNAGWQITWQGGGMTIRPAQAERAMTSLGRQILDTLPLEPGQMATSVLAERLAETVDRLRKPLQRLKSRDLIDNNGGHTAPGQELFWWRKPERRTERWTSLDTSDEPPF